MSIRRLTACAILMAALLMVAGGGVAMGAGAPPSFAASKLSPAERAGWAEAKRSHGLPPGTALPAWANEPGQSPWFAPSPVALMRARRSGNSVAGPLGAPEAGPAPPAGGADAAIRSGEVPPLRYLGGTVQHSPTLHVIFWGGNWEQTPGAATKSELLAMYGGLSGSSYQAILTQYFDPTAWISSTVSVNSVVDSRVSAPSNVTTEALEAEVKYGESKLGAHTADSQYVVFPAPGSTYAGSFVGSFCAFHDVAENGAIWDFVPYEGDEPFKRGNACEWYGKGNVADATSVLATHEYAESATDPLWNTSPGWQGLQGSSGEIGDLCATPGDKLPNGSVVQGEYDDRQNSCSDADENPPHILAITDKATGVTDSSATIRGTVDPEGSAATYHFEYIAAAAFQENLKNGREAFAGATVVPAGQEATAGSSKSNIGAAWTISGLQTETAYRYRLVAKNANGTAYGEAQTAITSHWRFRDWPRQTTYGWLSDVSCPSERTCMAVGYYYDPSISGEPNQATADRLVNGKWVETSVPYFTGESYLTLNGVSCPESSRCTAVGHYYASGHYHSSVAIWNGSSWSRQTITEPPSTIASELYEVSCVAGYECVAVGSRETSGGVWVDYSVQLREGSASNLETPTAEASGQSEVQGLACTSASRCVAVGWYNPSAGGAAKPFSMVLENGKWTLQGRSWSGFLESVTCTAVNSCIAVGDDYELGPSAETWTGSEWSTPTAASLPDVEGGYLGDVSCTASTKCTAVGGGWNKVDGAAVTLAETWNGSSWTEQATPRESEVAGNRLQGVACTGAARCVAVGSSSAAGREEGVIETRENRVNASYESSFGSSGNGNGQLSYPIGVTVDPSGNVWVADQLNNRIEDFTSNGEFIAKFGSLGAGNGQLREPKSIAFTANGNLWVTDAGNHRVEEFKPNGEYVAQFGSEGVEAGKFIEPYGIAIDQVGHIWVSDARYGRIEEFSSSGAFMREEHGAGRYGSANGEFLHPTAMTIDPYEDVWVVDTGNDRVQELSSSGEYLGKFGSAGSGEGQFTEPAGIAMKPSGNLLVSDGSDHRVEELTPTGEFLDQFGAAGSGAGQFSEPQGVALGLGGAEYAVDSPTGRVEIWNQPWTPEATTQQASNVGSSSANLIGTVDPSGAATTYWFEYGTGTAYGSALPASPGSAGSGISPVSEGATATGLQAETTYHFRIVASNSEGTAYGKDMTFKTSTATAGELSSMAMTDPFNGTTSAISNFANNWSTPSWAAGKGEDRAEGWGPSAAYPVVNGAYYSPVVNDTGTGIATLATMATNPSIESRYFSVWSDLSNAGGAKSGYELRFTETVANTYNVTLSKWSSGSQTVLASRSGYTFVNGNSFALVDNGGTVSGWTDTGSGYGQLLSAGDSTYSGGSGSVEGSGNVTRLTRFKVGALEPPATGMDAALKALSVDDSFAANESPLSDGGAFSALAWTTGTSGHNTGQVSGGWGPYDAYPTINGASWHTSYADTGAGDAVAATLVANPANTSRYFSLDLNMPAPATAHSGYELRFTETSSGVYEVTLARWQSGTKTVLASKTSYSFPVNSQFALVDKAGTVSAWTKTGSEFSQLLVATDATFSSGYAGLEGAGNIIRLKEFKAGPLAPF